MPGFEASTVIEGPIDRVWEFIDRPENELLWQSAAVEREILTEGPLEKGTRIRQVDRFLGRRLETEWEVVEHHEYVRMDRTISGPIAMEAGWRLEPVESGTVVTFELEAESGLGGFFGGLADRLVVQMARRDFDANLGKLKDLVEAET